MFGLFKSKKEVSDVPEVRDNLHCCIPEQYAVEHNLPKSTTYLNLCEMYTHTYGFEVTDYSVSSNHTKKGFYYSSSEFYINGHTLAAATATYPVGDFDYRVKPTKHVTEPVVALCNKMLDNPELFDVESPHDTIFYKERLVLIKIDTLFNTPNEAFTRAESILVTNVVEKMKLNKIQAKRCKERQTLKEILK